MKHSTSTPGLLPISDKPQSEPSDPSGVSETVHHVFLMCHRAGQNGHAARSVDAEPKASSGAELENALREAGYQVTASYSPIDSKRLLSKVRPSVLVLDPMVCSASGVEFELAGQLQTREDPIPLVVLVDDLRELTEVRRVPALFKDFMLRPFRVEELCHRVEQTLLAKQRYLELQVHARKLEGEVIRDFKTGLYTERHFRHLLSQEFQRAERHKTPLSFLLLDIDDFKQINDGHEYSFGDYVLTQFAEILRRTIREIDHAARFGGDEFMILLPNTTPAEAVQVAGRVRTQLDRRNFDNGTYRTRLTTSIGIDVYDGRSVSTPDELRRRANLALKEAKRRGKNRIWLYSDAPDGIDEDEEGEGTSEDRSE